MSRIYAFFDVDETLIRTKSMFDFFRFWCQLCGNTQALTAFEAEFAELFSSGLPREDLNRAYYRHLAGLSPQELQSAGEKWWREVSARPGLIIEESLALMNRLQGEGVEAVFVSGSFDEILEPVAAQMGVHHILCAPMIIGPGGIYTGEIGPFPSIGQGKRIAIERFLEGKGAAAKDCWAIGDDLSDLPMLEAVGHRAVVGEASPLADLAKARGWPVLESGLVAI
ncbi:HAD-IB family hydrolase [uncultured Sulfitobacter sp.]|uniref:HAD family hydrolase n=1 Tax=uncultured Sulfitobacter sp. TaxID=191468 RepID=UPI0025952318|nr:HAD-IB family hydrolase [uncultured Sulfitobacter sp.]